MDKNDYHGYYKRAVSEDEYAKYKEYYDLFTSSIGKKIYEDLIETYHNIESFCYGDPYATHYKDGQRSVVLGIKRIVEGIEYNLFKVQKEDNC